ncbi:MAG: hypothetical protein V1879_04625 [Pseudomonadota bacterium]
MRDPDEATAIGIIAGNFGNAKNTLSVPTPQAMSDTIARQFKTPSRAVLPAGIAWEGLGTMPIRKLNGIVTKQKQSTWHDQFAAVVENKISEQFGDLDPIQADQGVNKTDENRDPEKRLGNQWRTPCI